MINEFDQFVLLNAFFTNPKPELPLRRERMDVLLVDAMAEHDASVVVVVLGVAAAFRVGEFTTLRRILFEWRFWKCT